MALGIEPNELRLEDGLSMIYGSSISWVSPTKPATKEIYPARTFDQLVGDGKGRKLDRSILDAVLRRHARACSRRSARTDRKKLDEYLESVRDIEKRIDRASQGRAARRLAADARQAQHAASGRRDSAERAGPHEADAGSDRAGVPDGQDAHRDLHAEQRSFADELQVHRRRAAARCTWT